MRAGTLCRCQSTEQVRQREAPSEFLLPSKDHPTLSSWPLACEVAAVTLLWCRQHCCSCPWLAWGLISGTPNP
jgi:hypothetical protein